MKVTEFRLIRSVRRPVLCFAAVLALGVGSLGIVGTASAATASEPACSGSLVYRAADSVGEMVLYYSSSSDGTNCARTDHLGSTYGVTKYTTIYLAKCVTDTPGPNCTVLGTADQNDGNFAYYAGPVNQYSTNAHCVFAEGRIYYAPDIRYYDTSPAATACG